jgi:hypothetical protein
VKDKKAKCRTIKTKKQVWMKYKQRRRKCKNKPGMSKIFLSSPKCSDRLWGLTSLLFNGSQGMKLAIHR